MLRPRLRSLGLLLFALFLTAPAGAQNGDPPSLNRTDDPATVSTQRPAATYSIVARDSATGQLGVAVQSHWFSVGSIVPWAEPGVGAVATQSFVDPRYGPLGLKLMRHGRLDDAIPYLRRAYRQHEDWARMVPRLPDAGLLKSDALAQRLVETMTEDP